LALVQTTHILNVKYILSHSVYTIYLGRIEKYIMLYFLPYVCTVQGCLRYWH